MSKAYKIKKEEESNLDLAIPIPVTIRLTDILLVVIGVFMLNIVTGPDTDGKASSKITHSQLLLQDQVLKHVLQDKLLQ